MGKLMDYLMAEEMISTAEMEVSVAGFPHPFQVKSITEGEHKELKKGCQKVTFDKKTHQKQVELDQNLYNNRLVATCCVEPNFKDAQLQARYGVMGAEALIDRILKPGQFIEVMIAVQEVNGALDQMDDLRDEAKN